ncbi:MAG: hypothetical protein AAFN79_13780 [Pseudomonadota bacterium]
MNDQAERIQRLFGGDQFKFARWGGPISPVVVGLDDKGAKLFEEAIGAVAEVAGAKIDEIDPEMGANFMVYVMSDWAHAARAPNLPNFLPDLPKLIERLTEANANRYRVFAFDDAGAIRAAITLLRYDEQMQAAPVDYIALTEAALGMLVFDEAGVANDRPVVMARFEDESGEADARAIMTPWHAMLLKAAYDPAIPAGSKDPTLAMRLAARIDVQTSDEDEDEDGA